MNPACDFYLIQRDSFEVVAPLDGDLRLVPTDNCKLKHLDLPPRTAPLPVLDAIKEGA